MLRWPLGLDYTEADLASEADQIHLVGVLDREVVAVALLAKVPDGAKMRQVAVTPERQGQGLGRRLVEAFEGLARSQGFDRVVLHARETAVPFYRALGYQEVGGQFEEVGIPHRRMEKAIA